MAKNKETSEVDVIINGQRAIGSIKEMEKAMKEYKAIARSTEDVAVREKAIQQYRTLANQHKEFNEQLKGTNTLWGKMSDGFKSFGAAVGLAIGLSTIKELITVTVTKFAEAEAATNAFRFAVEKVAKLGTGSFAELVKQSKELAKITYFDDEDIQSAQRMLVQAGLNTAEVKKLTPLVLDLATAQGTTLTEAAEKAISAIQGTTRGLKDVGANFKDTGTRVENLNKLMGEEGLLKLQGMATDAINTTSGALKQQSVEVENLEEDIGKRLAPKMVMLKRLAVDLLIALTDLIAPKTQGERVSEGVDQVLEKLRADTFTPIEMMARRQQEAANALSEAKAKFKSNFNNKNIGGKEIDEYKKQQSVIEELTIKEKAYGIAIKERIEASAKAYVENANSLKTQDKNDPTVDKTVKVEKAKTLAVKKETLDREKFILEENLKSLDHWHEVQKLSIMQNYAEGKISEEEYQKQLNDVQKKYLYAKLFNLKQSGKDTIEVEQQITELTIKENQKKSADFKKWLKEAGNELKYEQEALQTFLLTGVSLTGESVEQMTEHIKKLLKSTSQPADEFMNKLLKMARSVSSIWSSINKTKENTAQAQLAKDKKHLDEEEKHLKFQLDKKLITQAQYDAKILAAREKVEKQERKIAHDVAVRNKNMGYFNALISTSEAIVGQLSMKPVGPWNIALAALMGIEGMAQVAEIASTPIPELRRGKRFLGIGRHPFSKKKVMEPSGQIDSVEEGETLLSAATGANNPIVDALLDASLNNDGRLSGSHPAIEQQFPQVNASRISETAGILRQGYSGGSRPSDGVVSLNGRGVLNNDKSGGDSEMKAILRDTRDLLSTLANNGIEANLSYVKFNRDKKRLDSITGQSN